MAKSFTEVMNEYKELASSKTDQGNIWERMLAKVLLKDSSLTGLKFSKTWLWNDWPYRGDVNEIGIDIVAQVANTDDYVAIQAKFHDTSSLSKDATDSFLTTSSRSYNIKGVETFFIKRFLFLTNDRITKNAEDSTINQQIPVKIFTRVDLEDSLINWDEFSWKKPEEVETKKKYDPKEHQKKAIVDVMDGFKKNDRGKLIMACGTGKTFTSLRLAEKQVKNGGWVLFLVPSISLLSQSLSEWHGQAKKNLNTLAVCSDSSSTKKERKEEDVFSEDLAPPASTDLKVFKKNFEKIKSKNSLNVVFCTYQSIEIVIKAQKKFLPNFDLVICDEAHRTSGIELAGKEKSHFTMVHDQTKLKAKKRLYMTATPKVFGEKARAKANDAAAVLCDMNDESMYGPTFHTLDFATAVDDGLLTDYKVLVLAIEDNFIKDLEEKVNNEEGKELDFEDLQKLVGCWNGLSKKTIVKDPYYEIKDPAPMKRAVAYCGKIQDSKNYAKFTDVTSKLLNQIDDEVSLVCDARHVDGKMRSSERKSDLMWLREDPGKNQCRILTNARCLSEGIDVPSLDAVIFFSPRASQIDVVQSVGRVMRKPQDGHRKDYGYVILPVGIPSDMSPEEALKDNKRYKVVWDVLNALRSHDPNMETVINSIELNKNRQKKVIITTPGEPYVDEKDLLEKLKIWKEGILTKIVKKVGERRYWEDWVKDVASMASLYEKEITRLSKSNKYKKRFDNFLTSLSANINPNLKMKDAIDLLSQHIVMKPIFNALFEDYEFMKENPVSKDLELFIAEIKTSLKFKENNKINDLVKKIKRTVSKLDNAEAKQTIIKELYEKFFKEAFPKVAERLGVVYTPNEVVDFIINSVEYIYQMEFGKSIASEGVHILDPFTGTGTFLARLLQSEVIQKKDLERKFGSELHASEIMLLAYYVACINIEECFHERRGLGYKPFQGGLLTDTFQAFEHTDDLESLMIDSNFKKKKKFKKLRPNIIIGNPPYSAKQSSGNDKNKNTKYSILDSEIASSYVLESSAVNNTNAYDSLKRAFKLSSNILNEDEGVVGFVTNGSYLRSPSGDGFRKTLVKEFYKIIVVNLRGDQRTSGEKSRKEGGKIFGSGSRNTISVTFLVKKRGLNDKDAEISYYEVEDYMSREEKLLLLSESHSVENIKFIKIKPDVSGDWLDKRNLNFEKYLELGNKKNKKIKTVFYPKYSRGLATGRDAWMINFSSTKLEKNVKRFLKFYHSELERVSKQDLRPPFDEHVKVDLTKISWNRTLLNQLNKYKKIKYNTENIYTVNYRPFVQKYCYFDPPLNDQTYLLSNLFPKPDAENIVISIPGKGSTKEFSCFVSDKLPDLNLLGGGAQNFPLYFYELENGALVKKDGVTDDVLNLFNGTLGIKVTRQEVFNYIYGVLHSNAYRNENKDNFTKMLARIPICKNFKEISNIGASLIELHLNYNDTTRYNTTKKGVSNLTSVNKIKILESSDKVIVKINDSATLEVEDKNVVKYIINGKSPLHWLAEEFGVNVDKDSGIINDSNDALSVQETIKLIEKLITVSLKTLELVASLPDLDIIEVNPEILQH